MLGLIYLYLNMIINIYILIAVYYYCLKVYGIKTTIFTNLALSSLVILLILTGMYSLADLATDFEFLKMKLGESEFFFTDIITIFTVFIVIFELTRFSLKKPKGASLSLKEIILVSIVVSVYGILLQVLMDPVAAVMGIYYYLTPPPINIFGFPVWFITSFAIYGLYSFVFLLIERYYYNKDLNLASDLRSLET